MRSKQQEISIVIADDQFLIRSGMRHIINDLDGFRVVADVDAGADALDVIGRWMPDIVILGLLMTGRGGFEIIHLMHEKQWAVAPIVLTKYHDEELLREALELGVRGYLLKDDVKEQIEHALIQVSQGGCYYSSRLRPQVGIIRNQLRSISQHPVNWGVLTPAEQRVYELVAECKSTHEIAELLCLSPRTVDHHREHICRKLNLSGRYSLLRFALKSKSSLPELHYLNG